MARDKPTITLERRGKKKVIKLPSRGQGFRAEQQGNLTLLRAESDAQFSERGQRLFRSIVYGKDGTVVSLGLPKFYDPPARPGDGDDLIARMQADEELIFTEKLDGQLIIRSVYKDKVYWRSRNAFGLHDLETSVLEWVAAHAPALEDPTVYPELSLQMEWCTPNQVIVIAPPVAGLCLVGISHNKTLQTLAWSEVEAVGQQLQLDTAAIVQAPVVQSIEELQAWVDERRDWEGVVVRDMNGMPLLRIKSAAWQQAYRFRYDYPTTLLLRTWDKYSGNRAQILVKLDPLEADLSELEYRLNEIDNLANSNETAISALQAVATENRSLTKRQQGELAQTYEMPNSLALTHLLRGQETAAREALTAYNRNRLCEQLDERSIIR